MPGQLVIVLGAPRLLGDLLMHVFASEPGVRLVVAAGEDPRAALATQPDATVVVLDRDGETGVVWRRDREPRTLAPVSLHGLLASVRER